MRTIPTKIQANHLQRQAYIYLRQSSKFQLQENQESTRRQYDLQNRARELGWPAESIVVIDEDLGRSASDPSLVREGFQRLLTAVVLGQAGAVFSLEVSRLARQDSEWHRLIEMAALTETLLMDEQEVYDPGLADDRLLLGLKGLLSSNEIRQMHLRLKENKIRKAARGELRLNLPVGLSFDACDGVGLDPDEQVQGAVRLLFERFRLTRRMSEVVRYFNENGLQFPKHERGWGGPAQWGRLNIQRVRTILLNPLYAGAYVYGRSRRKYVSYTGKELQQTRSELPPEDWQVVIWDAFPGYISRAEYEANLARLAENRQLQRGGSRRQDGVALLSGLVICGRCGQAMHVDYGGQGHHYFNYKCSHRQRLYGEPVCQRVPGEGIDKMVAQAVLAALTPAQLELSFAVQEELARQQAALRVQWERRLEGSRYTARLAQRRYEQVDPDNRLVARTLEREWEACLREIEKVETEFAQQQAQSLFILDEGQRQRLLSLVEDLPRVWYAETTTWANRKALLSTLIADVTLTREAQETQVQIRWLTNEVDSHQVPLPHRGAPPVPAEIVERVRQLTFSHSDGEIAEILNQAGKQTAQGKPFTRRLVQGVRCRYAIGKLSVPERMAPVVARVRNLSTTHTDWQIAEILNGEGWRTATGKPFTKAGVQTLRHCYGIRKPVGQVIDAAERNVTPEAT